MADFGFQTSQASGTSGIGGSGTTNYVSKFTAASTIGDSQIFDNGSNVGIGTNLPTAKLDVYINSITQLKYDSELTLNGLNGGIAGGSYLKFTAIPAQFYNLIRSSGNLGFTADGSFASMLLNSNGDLGVGLVAPTSKIHVKGIDATASNFALKVDNSASASLLSVRNDGLFIFNGTIDGASSGNNNFEYKTITGSTRSAYYGATGLETTFDFYTNSVKNTSVNEFSGYYAIIPKNRFSIKTFNDGKAHFWMDGIANGFIGIGDNYFVPTAQTHIKGIDATSSNYALKVENSTPTNLLSVRNDGVVDIYGTITPRLQNIVSSATVTPTNLNDEVVITAQATGLTLVNPTGTAVQGQSMIIRIKDNGTARTIAYDTQYRAIGVTLPTTTVINKIVYLGLIYNSTDTKWDVIGVSQEA
jgi:hypothetical protein